jgi:hypothetical protein
MHRVALLNTHTDLSQVVGKYQLTPTAARSASGSFTASLSIRSGRGQSTHDRVFRFIPDFHTAAAATCYAIEQGRSLLLERALPA